MSSSLPKILETGINLFKSNSQIMKNTKYYEISTFYECVEKLSMTIFCNIGMICLELNWFVKIRVECCIFLNLYGHYVLRCESFLTIFSLNTQQIEVRLVTIKSAFLSHWAYTPFYFSRTLSLKGL